MTDMLRALIDFASEWADEAFAKRGAIGPMWHAITKEGRHAVFPVPPSLEKDEMAMITRLIFEVHHVKYCLFVDEAWTAHTEGEAENAKLKAWLESHDGSLAEYPDKMEVVCFNAEDAAGNMMVGERQIIREDGKPAHLGPLIVHDDIIASEGRFVGMLPGEGSAN